MNAKGPVFKYGDNIDTDVIIPARYLNTQSPAELAAHCMEDIDKTFVTRVKAGDSMVGAMVLKLAQGASLLEMARYGVAAGSAATINQGTRLCSLADTQKIVDYLERS